MLGPAEQGEWLETHSSSYCISVQGLSHPTKTMSELDASSVMRFVNLHSEGRSVINMHRASASC